MKQFWALIYTDQELTSIDQVREICNEIEGNVSHVTAVTPSDDVNYAGN
jgi:hypothetical protein